MYKSLHATWASAREGDHQLCRWLEGALKCWALTGKLTVRLLCLSLTLRDGMTVGNGLTVGNGQARLEKP